MKQFLVQYYKDFTANFNNINAYIILAAYSILSFFSALYFGDYFLRESEIMNSYFVMQPLILMLVIPAVTMRSWSDEVKSGTIELLLTQPISYIKLATAKFAAAYSFFLVMVFFSLPFLYVTGKLSVLDLGEVCSAYIGLLLCGAFFSAAGCLVSLFCRNNILSYISTIFVIFFITQFRFGAITVGNLTVDFSMLNFEDNYNAFLSGIICVGNLFYFLSSTLLLLWLNTVTLAYKRVSLKKQFFLLFCLVVFIFVFGTAAVDMVFPSRFDMTSEQKFTLTEQSYDFLAQTDKRIDITLYESQNKREETNSGYAVYAGFTEQMFKMIEKASKGAVRTEFVRVEPFSALERKLIKEGIPFEEDAQGNKIYMKADFSDNDGNQLSINAFNSLRQNLLEADIIRTIRRFGSDKKDILLISSENDLQQMTAFNGLLQEFYNVQYSNFDANFIPNTFAAAILINPVQLSTDILLAMEQYIFGGGSLIIFQETALTPLKSGQILVSFLNNYGIRPIPEKIIEIKNGMEVLRIGAAKPTDDRMQQGIRSVIVNEAGAVNIRSGKNYTAWPILALGGNIIAALSEGLYVSDYLDLSAESLAVKPLSEKKGKIFFFYDSDMLKDYLYVSEESRNPNFYSTVPLSDNMLFLLRLMDYATNSGTEKFLTYRHYAVNVSSIGHALLKNIKDRYADQIEQLNKKANLYTEKQQTLNETLSKRGFATVKNIGDFGNIAQNIDETEDELHKIKAAMTKEYQEIVSTISVFLIFVIPIFLLVLLALVSNFSRKRKNNKIRRLIENDSTH